MQHVDSLYSKTDTETFGHSKQLLAVLVNSFRFIITQPVINIILEYAETYFVTVKRIEKFKGQLPAAYIFTVSVDLHLEINSDCGYITILKRSTTPSAPGVDDHQIRRSWLKQCLEIYETQEKQIYRNFLLSRESPL